MSNYNKTVVHYPTDASNLGGIYLRDVGMRNQLGGGKGIYVGGQDAYVNPGSDTTFISTSEVMLSATSGVIKHFVDAGLFTTTIVVDA